MDESKVIPNVFFNRPVLEICPELLGHYLVIRLAEKVVRVEITEVEAYDGPMDLACHASKGRTARTEVLYGPAGTWYVYLCYGVHWLLNIVTGPVDYPSAVLIRGVGDWKGPGILTRMLGIDKRFNRQSAKPENGLWFEFNSERSRYYEYETSSRIGVGYAGEWAAKPYRFFKRGYTRRK
ncbi:MAG: DNA-3-methyladenine glycosylase [Verrucomicrobia bacterium]|nr:DNA-3-methyladenine glycosylase [Verrucomicrobiota bacterium]MDA1067626.1 DNA-3-methyladenine glycosylase [Verrucomicrobiota bacterium]